MATDDYSPILQGDTGNPFNAQFLFDNGSPKPLTGATFSMKMQLIEALGPVGIVGTVKICSGPWIIDDAANGKAHYQYQPADVDTPGKWDMYPKVIIAGQSVTGDDGAGHVKTLVILPAP